MRSGCEQEVDRRQELGRRQKVELDGRQEVEVKLDSGPEVNSQQGLEVDGGQGLEVNGRQEVQVDAEQDAEQDVDGGLEMNRIQRRVGDQYAMGGIRLQSRSNTCRHQVYCLQKGHMRCMYSNTDTEYNISKSKVWSGQPSDFSESARPWRAFKLLVIAY